VVVPVAGFTSGCPSADAATLQAQFVSSRLIATACAFRRDDYIIFNLLVQQCKT